MSRSQMNRFMAPARRHRSLMYGFRRKIASMLTAPAARPAAAVILDAMRSANAAHGYPLALREDEALAATALRRALQQGA